MEEIEWETATHSDEDDGDIVVVATPTDSNNKPSVFPPTNHPGLPVTEPQYHHFHEPISAMPSPPSSLTPSSSDADESELPYEPRLGILRSGVLRIAFGIRSRIGFWSIASVAAVVVVMVYGSRWRKRSQKGNRDQMMLLINQKDEKIKQLLIQIEQMKAILSARRNVPVHRIVVDRPLINKPRLNWKPTSHAHS